MTNAKVHEGFRVDKKVEEHCSTSMGFCDLIKRTRNTLKLAQFRKV